MKAQVVNKRVRMVKALEYFIHLNLNEDEVKDLNQLALLEFQKPVKFRFNAMELLNKISERRLKENERTIASFG